MSELDDIHPGGVHGVSIAGFGESSSGGGAKNGILLSTTAAEEYDELISDWNVWPFLLYDSLNGRSHELEYFQSRTKYSAFDFEIEARRLPGARMFGTADVAVARITDNLSPTSTTVYTNDTGLANTPIWVGDECILLGSHFGGGIYRNCERGYYSSVQQRHSKNANIYDDIPNFHGRLVRLYSLVYEGGATRQSGTAQPSDAFTKTLRWVGKLKNGPEQDKGQIILKCNGLFGGEEGASLARRDRTLDGDVQVLVGRNENGTYAATRGNFDYTSSIFKAGNPQAFVVEGEVVEATELANTDGRYNINSEPLWGRSYEEQLGDSDSIIVDKPSQVNEVMVLDRDQNISPFPGSQNLDEFFRWHPLTMWAIINLSTRVEAENADEFDILRPDWSTNNSRYYVDNIIARVKELARKTRDFQLDRFVIGYNNEPQNLRKISREWFLRPFGFAEAPDKNGRVDLTRATTIDVSTYDAAIGNKIEPVQSNTLDLDTGREEIVDSAELRVGALPMDDSSGRREMILADDNDSDRTAYLSEDPQITFDFRTIAPDRTEVVKSQVIDRIAVQSFKIPRLTCQLEDWQPEGLDYGIGSGAHLDGLDISPAWIWDKDGVRRSEFGDEVQWTGVFQHQQYLPNKQAYVMQLLIVGEALARWRAPSGIVQSATTSNGQHEVTLGADDGGPSAFDLPLKDAAYFTSGDELEVWNDDGTKWSSSTIIEVSSVDVDNNKLVMSDTWPTDPTGKTLEIAGYDSDDSGKGYRNDGLQGEFTNVVRAYMYLADDQGTIGDADLDADVYGA